MYLHNKKVRFILYHAFFQKKGLDESIREEDRWASDTEVHTDKIYSPRHTYTSSESNKASNLILNHLRSSSVPFTDQSSWLSCLILEKKNPIKHCIQESDNYKTSAFFII